MIDVDEQDQLQDFFVLLDQHVYQFLDRLHDFVDDYLIYLLVHQIMMNVYQFFDVKNVPVQVFSDVLLSIPEK
jgi:hypothetical protein